MGRKPIHIVLKKEDQEVLEQIVKTGEHSSRFYTRSQILLLNHKGKTIKELQDLFSLSQPTVSEVLHRYKEESLMAALEDRPRSGASRKLTPEFEAHVTSVVCSEPPEGRCRWTLELLQEEVIALNYIDSISDESIRTILKKANLSLGWSNNGVLVR